MLAGGEQAALYRTLCLALRAEPEVGPGGREVLTGTADWSGASWKQFGRLAQAESVAPLLYWTFAQTGWPKNMPEALRESLQHSFYASAAQNAMLKDELVRLDAALRLAGVPAMVLKGGDLAFRLYPDPAARPMNDLDLLAQAGDLARTVRAIAGCGYELQKATYHAVLQGGPQRRALVEVHWCLPAKPEQSRVLDWLWEQSGSEAGLHRLGPTGNLLYLAGHLMVQHGADQLRLIWYYDLWQILKAEGDKVDWETLGRQAQALEWGKAVLTALMGMAERLGSPLAETEWQTVLEKVRGGVQTGAFARTDLAGQQAEIRQWMETALRMLGWRTRLWMGWRLLFPSASYMRWRYQPKQTWIWPIYYPVRWGEIARVARRKDKALAR